MTDQLKQRIEDIIHGSPVVLFMKGQIDMPVCGFSARVADVLRAHNIEVTDINILEDEELRQGVKEYADWPTFPQLWVRGELVGGCDIVMEMEEAGELGKALSIKN